MKINHYYQFFILLFFLQAGCEINREEKVIDKLPLGSLKGYVKFYFLNKENSRNKVHLNEILFSPDILQNTLIEEIGTIGGISSYKSLVISSSPGIHFYLIGGNYKTAIIENLEPIKVNVVEKMLTKIRITVIITSTPSFAGSTKITYSYYTYVEPPVPCPISILEPPIQRL